jgi:PAS domain S-box-containing protein
MGRFELLVRNAPGAILHIDASGGCSFANWRWCELSASSPDEAAGEGWLEAFHPDDREAVLSQWRTTAGTGEETTREHRIIRPDGSALWVAASMAALSPAGPLSGTVCLLTDISARKRAANESAERLEEERQARLAAEEGNRLKDQFLSLLSHELRAPLQAILGWSRLITTNPLGEEDVAHGLEIILRNVNAQKRLIDELGEMSRILSGKVELEATSFDLRAVIASAIETVRPEAEAREIRVSSVESDGASRLPLLEGDPRRIEQALLGLLSHAVGLSRKGGLIELSAAPLASRIEVRIEATAVDLERVPTAGASMGLPAQERVHRGLTLKVVERLIELHGGSLEESMAEERMAFRVALPRRLEISPERREAPAPPGAQPVAVAPGEARQEALKGLRVLVVDDDPDACELIRTVLERCAASVTTAESAAEALEHFQAEVPDVLVSDIAMADQDGYELILSIRALGPERGGAVPAIALSAYVGPEHSRRAQIAGYQLHLGKPVDPEQLVAALASITGRS